VSVSFLIPSSSPLKNLVFHRCIIEVTEGAFRKTVKKKTRFFLFSIESIMNTVAKKEKLMLNHQRGAKGSPY